MKVIGTSLKIAALAAIALASTASTTQSVLNYRLHHLTENGNAEPGFPYPYVGYSEYYCNGSTVSYGRVTGNDEYEFVANC